MHPSSLLKTFRARAGLPRSRPSIPTSLVSPPSPLFTPSLPPTPGAASRRQGLKDERALVGRHHVLDVDEGVGPAGELHQLESLADQVAQAQPTALVEVDA